ncbi:MAG: antitoxin family protein [Candidatus Methanospirare jalkutatii]|nr:antitoxin family protein [Candidatus Methanospirare jalkutatii]
MREVEVVYEGGVLKPLEKLNLREGDECEYSLRTSGAS